MKLTQVEVLKYKSIETSQSFEVNKDITVLVGMNESGKTAILESIAKSNYFQNDKNFKFNSTHDYPRREKKKLDKSGEDPAAIRCTYRFPDDLKEKILADLVDSVSLPDEFTVSTTYSNKQTFARLGMDLSAFIRSKTESLGIFSQTLSEKLNRVQDAAGFEEVVSGYKDENIKNGLTGLAHYFENEWSWDNPLDEYVVRKHIKPRLPGFLYYDEYYSLPSRISIEKLQDEELEEKEMKTGRALFELADINVEELINAVEYEDFKAELEATQATITDEIFKYWETNKNLEIEFSIDKIEKREERTVPSAPNPPVKVPDVRIVEHILDIRVKNNRSRVSLPLSNRSKGFNWFFSFLVWFMKIQEDKSNNYILLLDEPGLNLHASAQADLLRFLEDLSQDYQLIYTTHSPFMIESDALHRVRTVVESPDGTKITESLQEKDPNTLFPLQAALGYDIAQNLFVSKNNLLVEGPSDLLYLSILSNLLDTEGRTSLDQKITIVPVGGLDKVATFISLLRGQKLNLVCLLDSVIDQSSKDKLNDMIKNKIIREKNVRYFDEFASEGTSRSEIEDMFERDEYLKMFNEAFAGTFDEIELSELDTTIQLVTKQIANKIGKPRFNHFRPAIKLSQMGVSATFFSKATLQRFEDLFKEINDRF